MKARTMARGLRTAGLALVMALVAGTTAEAKLLAYYSFDDNTTPGGAFDFSNQGNTGTLLNTATRTASGHTGGAGDYALDLTPSAGAYVNLPTAGIGAFNSTATNNAATVSLWVYGNAAAQPQQNVNFAFYDASNLRQLQTHLPWSNQVIYWDVGGGSGGANRISKLESDSTKWEGQWNHYAFVKNGNTSKIYQNGGIVPWHQGTTTASLGQIVTAHLGIEPGGANGYDGWIDDFAIWDEELSATDIDNLATGAASPSNWAGPMNHYAQRVLADDPFAYYRFDNESGNNGSALVDWSGNGRSGTYENTNTPIEGDWPYSIGGEAAHFDPSPNTNRAAGTTEQPAAAITVEAWAKSDTATWNSVGMLVSKRDAFIMHPSGATGLSFYVHTGSFVPVSFDLASIPGFALTDWHQYVGVYDPTDTGQELKLYVDGLLRAVASTTGPLTASGQPVYIGYDNLANRYFDGFIDEVAIFDYALSFAQIRGHWMEAVPEPGTCTLLALGTLGLLRRRRKKSK